MCYGLKENQGPCIDQRLTGKTCYILGCWIFMDSCVIDVPDPRGMFLSRKWVENLGEGIQLEKVINLNTMFIEICMPLIAPFCKINS